MTNCDRCQSETKTLTGSWFNTQMICPRCEKIESKHPRFEEAKRREQEEVKKGNFNFEGIGL